MVGRDMVETRMRGLERHAQGVIFEICILATFLSFLPFELGSE